MYTKRLDEGPACINRAKQSGKRVVDTKSSLVTADRGLFPSLGSPWFRSRGRRKASSKSEKELFCSVKYRRPRPSRFFPRKKLQGKETNGDVGTAFSTSSPVNKFPTVERRSSEFPKMDL